MGTISTNFLYNNYIFKQQQKIITSSKFILIKKYSKYKA